MSKEQDSKIFRTGPDGATTVESQPNRGTTQRSNQFDEMTFSTHIMSLNVTALMHLGSIEGIAPNERDPSAARHLVETLMMLQEKTSGNLTDEESNLLRTLLYDLKLKIVQSS